MDNNVIKFTNVKVSYGKNTILNNINFNVKEGEIIGLIGPSGSGKTTLVKGVIGMKEVSEGEVTILNKKMPCLEVTKDIGYMAQSDALYDDLSALDNILFFGELYGIKGKEGKNRAKELLTLVSLENDYKKKVKNFSGGMKRRLSLAISLIHKPKILILDEPTVGIDPILRRSFWAEFKKIKNAGGTILVTTHVMDEAYNCDRLILIRDGNIIADGAPSEIIEASGGNTIEDAFLYFSTVNKGALNNESI